MPLFSQNSHDGLHIDVLLTLHCLELELFSRDVGGDEGARPPQAGAAMEYNGSIGLCASGDRWLLVEALHQLRKFQRLVTAHDK